MDAEKKTTTKSVINADLVITAIIAIVCVYMLTASGSFRFLGRLFPQVISAVTLLACVAQAIITIRKSRAAVAGTGDEAKTGKAKDVAADANPAARNHLLIAVIAVIYLCLMPVLGFIVCTLAIMMVIPPLLGYRNRVVICILAIVLTLSFYIVFKRFFYVPLPQGILTFI